jgi:hypothetical protein
VNEIKCRISGIRNDVCFWGGLAGTLDTGSDEKATEYLFDFQGLGYGTLTCGE